MISPRRFDLTLADFRERIISDGYAKLTRSRRRRLIVVIECMMSRRLHLSLNAQTWIEQYDRTASEFTE